MEISSKDPEEPTSNHFKFEILTTDSPQIRIGKLITRKGKEIETPTCLLYTRKGLPENLTPDLLKDIPYSYLFQVALHDLYIERESIEKFNEGLKSFVNCPGDLYLSVRDPSYFNDLNISDSHLNIYTHSGNRKVSLEDYIKLVKACQPEFYESPSIDAEWNSSLKRTRRSVEISLKWLDQSLLIQKNLNYDGSIFGVIQGGNNVLHRTQCAIEVNKRPVAGFVLGSLGLTESSEERKNMVSLIIQNISPNKPRILPGVHNLIEILDMIELGIDLFNSNYVDILTEWGYALVLSFEESSKNQNLPFKINLRDHIYQTDSEPVLSSCKCYTCTHHTRAYLHHLLNTHELLVNILLMIHNTNQYLLFFKVVRENIKKGTFSELKQRFIQIIENE